MQQHTISKHMGHAMASANQVSSRAKRDSSYASDTLQTLLQTPVSNMISLMLQAMFEKAGQVMVFLQASQGMLHCKMSCGLP